MLIKSLHLKNILSFKDTKLDLQPLNVLIGPNGSGKSNLLDVIAMLQAVPNDLPTFFRRNGPISDWVWNAEQPTNSEAQAHFPELEVTLADFVRMRESLKYQLGFSVFSHPEQYHISSESLEIIEELPRRPRPVLEWDRWYGMISSVGSNSDDEARETPFTSNQIRQGRSVLSEIRDPLNYPVAAITAQRMASIKLYSNWVIGRSSIVRRPQPTDGPVDFVEEDFSNVALVVHDLKESHGLGPILDGYLQRFYETYSGLNTPVNGNAIRLTARETGLSRTIPASRLSDGTIRFIALLAILCHPEPPPLICIEEPEIAMHPDSLGLIAELLRKASERTQIIVATHSPELVSHFSDEPEHIVVCDRDAKEGTQFRRLSRQDLDEWQEIYQQTGKELVVYGLSEMWMSGSIGGVRW